MKRELKLKDIIGYLPYGLKVKVFDPEREIEITGNVIEIRSVDAGKYVNDIELLVSDGLCAYYARLDEIQPVLRHISCLFAVITNNGKEMTPILEYLYNVADFGFPLLGILPGEWRYSYDDLKIEHKNGVFARYDNGLVAGGFDGVVTWEKSGNELYDFMNELKIDYRGLIDAGLAIGYHEMNHNFYN
jgi:hypothetical protein